MRPMPVLHGMLAGSVNDPYWANVVALLRFRGNDGEQVFVDETGKTWFPSGNAQTTSNTGAFDGAGDFIYTDDSADFDFGAGVYTVEAVTRFATAASNSTIISQWSSTVGQGAWALFIYAGELYWRFYDTGNTIRDTKVAFTPTAGVDYHIAADKDASNVVRLYVNGTVVASQTYAQTMLNSPNGPRVGLVQGFEGTFDFNGVHKAVRVTKGVCRYGGAFSPPALPYPDGEPTAPTISAPAGITVAA